MYHRGVTSFEAETLWGALSHPSGVHKYKNSYDRPKNDFTIMLIFLEYRKISYQTLIHPFPMHPFSTL